jgi:hypothetical protein
MIQIAKISKQNTEKKETLVYSNAKYHKKSYLGNRVQITHNVLPKQLKFNKDNKKFHILVNGFYSYHINLILESLDYNLDKITNIQLDKEGVLTFESPFGTYKTTEIKKY